MRGIRKTDFYKPSADELRDLYEVQRLNTMQIAGRCGVANTSVKNWLKVYGIQARAANNGLLNRGITPPTRDELIELVHGKHHSYEEIANMYGLDKTAISYWMKKYDIPRPTIWDTRYKDSKPVMPDESTLRDLYEVQGLSLVDIGELYGVKSYAMRSVCRKYGIAIKPDGWTGQRYECEDGHKVRSVYEQRIDNWLYQHEIEHEYEPQLPFDHRFHADFLARGYYIEMWGVRKNKTYDRRRQYKTKLYVEHNLPLIQITESRMTSNAWQKHLEKHLLTEHLC